MFFQYDEKLNRSDNFKKLREAYGDTRSEVKSCVFCGSTNSRHVTKNIVRLWDAHEEDDASILICGTCGTFRISHVYDPAYYFEYINNFYGCTPIGVEPGSFEKALIRKSFILRMMNAVNFKPKKMLEVSSYNGVSLDVVANELGAEAWGIEPTSGAVDAAKRLYPDRAEYFINTVFEEAKPHLQQTRFDFIMISYAFRQIAHPLKALSIIDDLLTTDGWLYLDEGSLNEGLVCASDMEIGYAFFQQKTNLFSLNALLHLFESHGFEYIASNSQHEARFVNSVRRHTGVMFRRKSDHKSQLSRLEKSRLIGEIIEKSFAQAFNDFPSKIEAIKKGI